MDYKVFDRGRLIAQVTTARQAAALVACCGGEGWTVKCGDELRWTVADHGPINPPDIAFDNCTAFHQAAVRMSASLEARERIRKQGWGWGGTEGSKQGDE